MATRLTVTQVIELGDYLEPSFNPKALTVPQLLGLLTYHNIPYPSPYSKPKLITVFNDQLKAKAAIFQKERLDAERMVPSTKGIIDGHTGDPVNTSNSKVSASSSLVSNDPNVATEDRQKGQAPSQSVCPRHSKQRVHTGTTQAIPCLVSLV